MSSALPAPAETLRADSARETQSVAALARGIMILEQFNQHRQLSGAEIARLTGLAQPTVWRLCYTLKSLGVLQDGSNNKMRLGTGVLALGFEALSELSLPEVARPYMQEMADEFGTAVTLAIRQGTSVIYVQRCQSEKLVFSGLRVGTSSPIPSSPTGWALIAGSSPNERTALLGQLTQSGALKTAAREELARALERYERSRFVDSHGLLHPSLTAVSAPLRKPDEEALWALSCGGHESSFHGDMLDRAGVRMRELAELLSPFVPDPA